MTEFILELYVPRHEPAAVAAATERLAAAATELTAEGRSARLVRSIFVPEDETCFLLVEGDGIDDVRELARRAALPVDHVAATSTQPALHHHDIPRRTA
jgi:hypothetical protein